MDISHLIIFIWVLMFGSINSDIVYSGTGRKWHYNSCFCGENGQANKEMKGSCNVQSECITSVCKLTAANVHRYLICIYQILCLSQLHKEISYINLPRITQVRVVLLNNTTQNKSMSCFISVSCFQFIQSIIILHLTHVKIRHHLHFYLIENGHLLFAVNIKCFKYLFKILK